MICKIEAMEDIRILVQAQAQGAFGAETLRKHSTWLMHSAIGAFEDGNYDECVWFAEREAEFNRRAFGAQSQWTRSSMTCLSVLKRSAAERQNNQLSA